MHNLEADPHAQVTWRGTTVPVRARPASAEEAADVWRTAGEVYVGFSAYRSRIHHRQVRIFVLEPAG